MSRITDNEAIQAARALNSLRDNQSACLEHTGSNSGRIPGKQAAPGMRSFSGRGLNEKTQEISQSDQRR